MKTIRLDPPQPTATPHQSRIDLPASVGQGGTDILGFASGLQLMTTDWRLEHFAFLQQFVAESSVGFGFCLDGLSEYRPASFYRPFKIKAGESGFFSFPKAVECLEKVEGKQMFRIHLMIDADHLFKLAKGDEDRFSPVLKSLERKAPFRMGDTLMPAMQAVLKQMLHCPYCGMTRQLFLEGKAMELLAQKLEQLCPCGCHGTGPSASDTERVHHAARLLVHDLENPPDIMTLTRSVGLNRNKLHRCFRQVFGRSPFDYLRNQRLQAAMQLLQEGEVNVTEASLMVGYTNLSHFAKAFKSMFGITPGELRKSSPTFPARGGMKKLYGLAGVGFLMAFCIATTGLAGEQEEVSLGTMTVTAQKREENVQKVPVSISAFSDQALFDAGIDEVSEVARFSPNVYMKHESMVIRGVSQYYGAKVSAVGFYLDGVSLPFEGVYSSELFDIERIEVLKGPQGTLYGKNSESGLILHRSLLGPRNRIWLTKARAIPRRYASLRQKKEIRSSGWPGYMPSMKR